MTQLQDYPSPTLDRLAALRRTALLDTPAEEGFDRLTRMAARLLGAPVALITLIADDHQFFKSATGLAEPWASRRATPLTHSFCRHVVSSGRPLVVEDARHHPLLRTNPAVRDFGWIAYAGIPLVTAQGHVVGALSVIDAMPRLWSERDLSLLTDLGACAASEIELRTTGAERPAEVRVGPWNGGPRYPDLFEQAGIAMGVASPEGRWVRVNPALCELLGHAEDELLGAPTEKLTHPDDRPSEREALRLLLAGECTSYTQEKRCLDRAGEPVWTLVTVTLVRDAKQRPHHFVVGLQQIDDRVRAEAALREREERYRMLVEAARDVGWDWDLGTDRIVWSGGIAGVFEQTPPDFVSTAAWWYQRIHGEDRERVVAAIQGALARGERSWHLSYRFRRGDGTYAHVASRGTVLLDPAGEPVRMIGTMADETGHRREESLAGGQSALLARIASGEPLSAVLDAVVEYVERHAPGVVATVMILDPDTGALRLGSAPSLPDAGLSAWWSVPVVSSESEVLGTLALYCSEPREPGAEEQAIVAIASDLAGIAIDRSRIVEALGRSQRLLQQVLEALPVGVWVVSPRGEIVLANAASRRLWGDDTPSDRAWLVHSGRRVTEEDAPAARALRGETLRDELVRIERADGGAGMVLASAVPMRGPAGEIAGAIVLYLDVTEQQVAEEALRRSEEQLRQAQKMEAVGQLAGGIAHDFNNLLTGILSYCDLVLDEVRTGDPIRSDVEQIRQAGQRAAGLTRQLLAFSRRQVLQPRVLSLNGILGDLDGMLRRLAGADVTVEMETDPGLWYVLADPGQLEQVVINLVVNARDAMAEGGRLNLATANRVYLPDAPDRPAGIRPGAYVALTLSDTGVGMDAEVQSRIFEPFFTTKEPGKGTGLGLSTVYGIVRQSGGHVMVRSAPGEGAAFTVLLPRHTGGESTVAPRPDRRRLPGGAETLLLVEDEAAVRSSARRLLERNGYTVLEARHGGDALRIAEASERPIDLVLTDLVMPEMGGRELAERLRAHRPGLKVVFMSGYTEKAIAVEGVMPAHTGFVEKPFTVEQLMRRVREILDG